MNLLDKWVKPNGVTIELNQEEATIEFAIESGWVPWNETPEGIAEAEAILAERERRAEETLQKAKRKRRTKAEMEADGDSCASDKGDTTGNTSTRV
jgi:hypothetical protein